MALKYDNEKNMFYTNMYSSDELFEHYKECIELYGSRDQHDQLKEELAELSIAVNKLMRFNEKFGHRKGVFNERIENTCEEIADVLICLDQFKKLILKSYLINFYDGEFDTKVNIEEMIEDIFNRKITRTKELNKKLKY